jgi:hypothetical protein
MFDYAMILASVVIGLAVTHLMQGLAGLVQRHNRERIWWVHLVWVAAMLLVAVSWWWWEYYLHSETWTFEVYLFVLLYAFCIYLACALLFPRETDSFVAYDEYFMEQRGWFFGLQIALNVIDVIDSALKGTAHLKALGTEYWVAIAMTTLAAIVCIVSANKRVQAIVAVLWLLYLVSWLPRQMLRMG